MPSARDVHDRAVHEEAGRSVDMAPGATVEVRADPVNVHMRVESGREEAHVELEASRVVIEMTPLETWLILEEQVVHLPEFALRRRTLGRFGGGQRVWMNLLEREVPVREVEIRGEASKQQLHGGEGELSDDPFPALRTSVYALSFARRQQP